MRKIIIIGILVAAALLLSACSECKKAADCEDKACFTTSCSEKKCTYTPLPDCCGNGIKDRTENGKVGNECTCSADYGACTGSSGKYLEKACNKERTECAYDIKTSVQKMTSNSFKKSASGIDFKFEVAANNPFNIDADTFNVEIGAEKIATAVSEVKVTKLTLSAKRKNGQEIVLGQVDSNKYVWDTSSTATESIILDFQTDEKEEELNSLTMLVNYEYLYESRGTKQKKAESFKLDMKKVAFSYANPTIKQSCPESCDDGNDGTADSCSALTGYFCRHTPVTGKCGNFKCEAAEDKCSCPEDCGQCSGTAGEYMEYGCAETGCVAQLKPQATVEPKALFEERSAGKMKFNIKYIYNLPFDINEDKFKIEFELLSIDSAVTGAKITKAVLLESSNLLAEEDSSAQFSSIGDSETVEIPMSFAMSVPEVDKTVTAKVYYQYNEPSGGSTVLRQGSFTKSIGSMRFIRPG